MKPIQVGLLGIGTVGSGTFEVLKRFPLYTTDAADEKRGVNRGGRRIMQKKNST